MPVEFSQHARNQLKRRGISQKLVRETVSNYDEIISSFRGRKLRQRQVGDKILEVVTKTEGKQITVVTAYFLKETK